MGSLFFPLLLLPQIDHCRLRLVPLAVFQSAEVVPSRGVLSGQFRFLRRLSPPSSDGGLVVGSVGRGLVFEETVADEEGPTARTASVLLFFFAGDRDADLFAGDCNGDVFVVVICGAASRFCLRSDDGAVGVLWRFGKGLAGDAGAIGRALTFVTTNRAPLLESASRGDNGAASVFGSSGRRGGCAGDADAGAVGCARTFVESANGAPLLEPVEPNTAFTKLFLCSFFNSKLSMSDGSRSLRSATHEAPSSRTRNDRTLS